MKDMQQKSSMLQKRPVVSVQSFGAKFQTKHAIHYFLTVEVGAYLPPKSCVTMYYLRDLINGKRKCKLSNIPSSCS